MLFMKVLKNNNKNLLNQNITECIWHKSSCLCFVFRLFWGWMQIWPKSMSCKILEFPLCPKCFLVLCESTFRPFMCQDVLLDQLYCEAIKSYCIMHYKEGNQYIIADLVMQATQWIYMGPAHLSGMMHVLFLPALGCNYLNYLRELP